MRDLQKDLELCNEFKREIIDKLPKYEVADILKLERADLINRFHKECREGWPHAIERALEAEKHVTELENQIDILSTTLAMYCSPYYDMQERAEKAEALARELVHHLDNTACVLASRVKLARKDLIGRTRDGGTQWASDVLGEVKQVVTKAKEVLGDE